MRLSTSTNILFERSVGEPIQQEKCIQLCYQAGYRVLDFCFHDLTTYESEIFSKEWRKYFIKIRKLADSLGIEFHQGHGVVYDFCRNDINHEYYEMLLQRCIEGAGILGVKWLVLHPSTVMNTAFPRKDSKEKNIEFFTKWCQIAEEYNVGLAVENMWDYHSNPIRLYCTTAEELIELVDEVPGLGICWDVEHGAIMQQNQLKALQAIGDRLKGTHISDYTNGEDIHLLPYLGKTDWNQVMEAFATVEYQGDFNFEIHRYLTKMPLGQVETAIQLSFEVGMGLLDLYELKKKEQSFGK